MFKEKVINIEREDGTSVEYQVLYSFHSEEYNRDYVFYTDEVEDDNGDIEILLSWYDEKNNELVEIEDDEEWHKASEKLMDLNK
jgi:uncharacterized protein YrzB (UPF0473 family)